MTQLMLTEEQARLIRTAKGQVPICDPTGHIVGHAQPAVPLEQLSLTDRQIVENYLRRRHEPKEKGYSSSHVQAMLRALDQEWQRTGGFDKAQMDVFLRAWRNENPA